MDRAVDGKYVITGVHRIKGNTVGRGQCLRSKLATERSRVCLHPAVMLFALSFGFAQTNENHLNPCRDRRPRLSVVEKFTFESKRTVRQLVARTPCPYNVYGGRCAAILFVLAVCFLRGVADVAPYKE